MFKFSLKRFIATILVVAMIFTSTGFAIFAESIDDMDITMSSAKESSSSKYHEEDLNEQVLNNDQYDKSIFEGAADSAEVSLASTSYTEGEEDYSGEYEEEPEDDETKTLTKLETDEISCENDETTIVEVSEEETSTTGESNLVDANDITSIINIDEQIDTNIVETENNEIATISIVDEGIVNLVKTNDEIASSSDISNDIEEKGTSILATESETILDIEKSSESEINVETALSFFGDTTLFGDAAPDTIWLGTYPQSATWQNDGSAYNIVEPIKWRKLSQNDTEALYIADQILDNVSYHTANENTTWADSGIHSWLNDTSANGFIGKAFTTNQLDDTDGIILEKTIVTTDSANTDDKAFLLSKDEAQSLFIDNNSRLVSGTNYAKSVDNGGFHLYVSSGHSYWWLRSPGSSPNAATLVGMDGSINADGYAVDNHQNGVRPAIYINLSSPLYKTSDNGVSWELNGGSFETNSTLWESMNTYFGGQALPTADNFIVPTGKYFIGVSINTETKSTINTIIPDDLEGDITLRPLFGDSATDKIINYDFGAGIFTGWLLLPGNYTPGNAQPLPTKSDLVRYITPPADKEFKGFAKSGTTDIITEIADTETTDIDLVAIYGDRPTITWNMGSGIDIGTLDPEVASTSYISGIEWPLPLQDKVTPPNGCEFDHWILRRAGAPDINPATIIPETLDVNVEIIAVYNPLTYNITWDMGTGSDGGTLDPIVASASYTHGTSYSLPMSDKITPPVGREFDHWKLIKTGSGGPDIEPATNIDKAVWGDITIKAVYNNLTFPITWILNGATIDEALMPAEHTYGTATLLPNASSITPASGKEFDYWLVNGARATSITATMVQPITVTLIYKGIATHHITWDYAIGTDNEWSFENYIAPETYTEGVSVTLPDASKVKAKNTNKEFDYWIVNGSKATEISSDLRIDVTVKAVLKNKIDKDVDSISVIRKPKVSYNLNDYFNPNGLVIKVNYTDGSTANIVYSADNANKFAFEPSLNTKLNLNIKIVNISYSGKTTTLDITVNNAPTPTPPGGGGSNGGGSSGSGVISAIQNQIVHTTYIDQIKTINAIINSNEIVWIYDPIVDTFKMNITTNGQTVPANSGFYLINNVVEQNINSTIINNISTNTYYFDKYGNMLTGWVKTNPDNKWYFLENAKTVREGSMVFGWYKVQNDWYYFDKDGAMLVNTTTPDGYAIGSDGRWIQ